MTEPKRIDRKSFLSSTFAAWATVTLSGCGDDGDGGGTGASGGTGTGGTGQAGSGGSAMGGTTAGGGAGGTPPAGGAGAGGTQAGGAGAGGSATGGNAGSGAGAGGSSGGGTAGDGMGGMAGNGGGTLMCTTDTDNGNHSHPLTIPPSDVERGAQDAPYVLEDGGTGHTHTVTLTAYDFAYLQGGVPAMRMSTTDGGHSHVCVITCTES